MPMPAARAPLALLAAAALACGGPEPVEDGAAGASERVRGSEAEPLATTLERAQALRQEVLEVLRPVALLTPAQENALRRYDNAAQLARARQLATHPGTTSVDTLLARGRLVELEDSTELWVVRAGSVSAAYVTPDAYALLEEIGRRFQARLEAMGLPRYRVEVTSALRTPEAQAQLRRTNPNAAAGTSTHEFGTTYDLAYESFPAPAEVPESAIPDDAGELRPHLEQVVALALDAASSHKSRELQAILGGVLRQLQDEGAVMVTLERQQPVFHMTVARRLAR